MEKHRVVVIWELSLFSLTTHANTNAMLSRSRSLGKAYTHIKASQWIAMMYRLKGLFLCERGKKIWWGFSKIFITMIMTKYIAVDAFKVCIAFQKKKKNEEKIFVFTEFDLSAYFIGSPFCLFISLFIWLLKNGIHNMTFARKSFFFAWISSVRIHTYCTNMFYRLKIINFISPIFIVKYK